ncbi:MAG: polysaccharide deacetylase family protein [Clostridia bacterium]|nr:polysaccharide deacetylase family protein [Clostridia bacterium]
MKNKNIKLVTDIILLFTVIAVFLVGFFPQGYVTIFSSSNSSVIYKGSESSGGVALTFNVYENTEVVNEIMELLLKKGATATFYVGGCWADDNGETIKKIVENGFEIGNHGYFHKDHKKLSYKENISEISNCSKIVKSFTGYDMKLFAPPSGSYGQETINATKKLGYTAVMWSKDTIDWRDTNVDLIVKRATNSISSGDIILMHPKKHTLQALETIIDKIDKKGLKTLTVSTCVGLEPIKV